MRAPGYVRIQIFWCYILPEKYVLAGEEAAYSEAQVLENVEERE